MTGKAAASLFHRYELVRFEERVYRILTLCNSKSLKVGLYVHSPIIKLGLLQDNPDLSNNLLSLYTKCDSIENARHLFDEMSDRDVVSWTGMISAYTKTQKYHLALELFDEMTVSRIYPNDFTFSTVLRSCAGLGELGYGTRVHACVIKHGFESNLVLCSSLIDLYSKCHRVEEAYELFGCIKHGDTVSWTTMISSFVQAQKWRAALGLYADMIEAGVCPSEFTFVKLLAASASFNLACGKVLHSHIIIRGIELNIVLKTALVDLYSRFQEMADATKVLNLTPEYDVFLWTAVISGFARNLQVKQATDAFLEMQVSSFRPNNYTFSTMLSLCSSLQSLGLGKQIHSQTIRAGYEDNVDVGNALVDMYMKCSSTTEDALRVFRGMNSSNVISWTALISGLADHCFEQGSFELFKEMIAKGIQPNSVTLSSILRAGGQARSMKQILELHGYILRTKADSEITIMNSLVDAYARSGMVDDAWRVISMMDHRDSITYTSLVTRQNQIGHYQMALSVINCMYQDGINVDPLSLSGFLSASANLGALETGKHLHGYSVKTGLSSWLSVLNGLVDLYGKCGCPEDAKRGFEEITEPDVVSWNALISGLATNGYTSSALSAFDDMRLKGTEPNSVTFLLVLSACSHGKLVEMGLDYFQSMRKIHNMDPQIVHYAYLVDLLGRAGRLEDAIEIIETMPFRPNALIFKTLLSSCRFRGNLPLGEDMARRGLELDPFDPAFYMLLADLYRDSGKSELAEKTQRLMRERGLTKKPGQCSVEIRGKINNFMNGDVTSRETMTEVYEKIESLMCEFETLGHAYRDKQDASYHSAKLAVAFGLVNAPPKAPIHVVKNKHLCKDCHNFISLVSKVAATEITVRDGKFVHTFKNGDSSCKGKPLLGESM